MSSSSTPSPNRNHLSAILLLAVAIFGPPSVATLAFTHAVTQNPWLTAVLILLYEILVFIVSIVGKIWQRLESPLIDSISEWIMLRVQGTVSGYRQNYCQHLIYEHQVLDIKGLSTQTAHALELEQIFVELSIDPKPVHQATSDPFHIPKPLRTGKHSIWDYIALELPTNQHLVVVGAPGSGKTTLLKHITLTIVKHRLRRRKKQHAKIPHLLPILLFLRDHAARLKEKPDFSLVDAVQDHMSKKWQQSVPTRWITRYLSKGVCLILLDGLDEVADPVVRRQMAEWVQQQLVSYGQNRFILTSRPYGYRDNPLNGVTVLEVQPFMPNQIERFVQNWYLANEIKSWGQDDPGAQMRAREGAQDLLRRLYRAQDLLSLAVNPLLLTMIATVHRYRSSLPGKRVDLYAEVCEVFLGKRQEAHGVAQELTSAQIQQVLQPLAYHLMQQGKREITLTEARQVITPPLALVSLDMQPDMFLQLVQNTSGLFLEREPEIYSFAHLSFQEYLAAVAIKETGLEHFLITQVRASWWHETIRLYCAQADATALITACLVEDDRSVSTLILALECEQEALKIQPSARKQLKALLDKGIEDSDPNWRRIINEALLAQRLRQMIHLHEEVYIDTSLVTCAEYQVFLDEQNALGIYCQPDHWNTKSFLGGQGRNPILGVQPSDVIAFCHWLTERELRAWHYRLPEEYERKRIEMDKSSDLKLTSGAGYWINEGKDFAWTGEIPLLSADLDSMIRNLWNSDMAHSLRPDHDSDLVRALNRIRDHIGNLTHNEDFSLDQGLVGNRDMARSLGSLHALNLTHVQGLDFNPIHIREHILRYDPIYPTDVAKDLARDLAYTYDLVYGLVHNLDCIRSLDQDHVIKLINMMRKRFSDRKEAVLSFLWSIRYSLQIFAYYFSYLLELRLSGDRSLRRFDPKSRESLDKALEDTVKSYLDLYMAFALLELRIQGEAPAWEGILLVKERKQESEWKRNDPT